MTSIKIEKYGSSQQLDRIEIYTEREMYGKDHVGGGMTTDELIDEILRREGGYTDHPADKGGPTKYGITQATLSEWRGGGCTVDDVRELGEAEARAIYRHRYIADPRFYQIDDQRLRALIVDCGVNHGVSRAAKWLQESAKVTVDGIVGQKTLAAVNAADAQTLYCRVLARRIRFYGEIISRNHSQAVFARGWLNRAAEFLDG